MLRPILLTLLFCLLSGMVQATEQADKGALEAGVPRQLARWRAAHYRDVRYALNVELTPGADRLKGTEEIRVTLDASVDELVLDWRVVNPQAQSASVRDLNVNGHAVADARLTNEHI